MSALLKGKVAMVTGGARGIGRAIAERLAEDGATVVLASRDEQALKQACEALPGSHYHVLDVTDAPGVDRVVDQAAETHGSLDVVVNNAGVIHRASFLDHTEQQWMETMEVNLTGAFRVTRAALRHMQTGGRIVNVSSVLGIFGVPDASAYVASKHALLGLTRTTALEVAPKGITVNAVCPGWTESEMTDDGIADFARVWGVSKEQARARIEKEMMPIGRILKPEEIAAAVSWLCSEAGAAVTAQAIRVDGGQTPY